MRDEGLDRLIRPLAFDEREIPCAQTVKLDDDRALEIVGVLLDERVHARVPRELRSEGDEPNLRAHFGVTEAVDLLNGVVARLRNPTLQQEARRNLGMDL